MGYVRTQKDVRWVMSDLGLAGDDLEQMYQEFILDVSRDPHGKVHFATDVSLDTSEQAADTLTLISTAQEPHAACVMAQSHQFNPTCGDEVTVRLELSDGSDGQDPHIQSLVWDGHGCSISQASLSVMTDMVVGTSLEEFTTLSETFHNLMTSRGKGLPNEADNELLGDATAFEGVSKFPMRIKCALLGWAAVKDSLAQALTQLPAAQPAKA